MSHDICPDTGEPCTCDGSEPCTCGCGGCGHTAEEEAAAAAYRDAHREGPSGDALDHERKIIRLPRCHRRPHNPCRLPSARPLTISTTTLGTGTFVVVSLLEWPSCGITSQNHHKGACPQCGGMDHMDETALKHAICSAGAQKRFYLHRNQNETSARRLMRNFAATVRYYPYSIKLAAHGAPRTTFFFSINWRKHELHAESSRRAQGPLSRAA